MRKLADFLAAANIRTPVLRQAALRLSTSLYTRLHVE
jgi:hypothetical protein